MREDYLIKLCRDLIRIKSYSCEEDEIAHYIRDVMKDLGYKTRIDEIGNVIGEIDEGGKGSVVFEGHMDTVPADEKQWKHKPFDGAIEGNRIYGRGASDMKGALSAIIYGASLAEISGKLSVVCVPMEEIFEGVAFGKALESIKPDFVVLGESTELNLDIAQRGRAEVVVETKGVPAHSSNPDKGINAVYDMMRVIDGIRGMTLPSDPFMGRAIIELTDIISSPYPGASVVPYSCRATFDRRLLLGEGEDEVIGPINALFDGVKGEAKIARGSAVSYTGKNVEAKKLFPAWKMNEDNAMVKEALKAVKGINEKAEISRYSFCTDGSESAGKRGITTVGFGPSKESMAHTNDEFIEIDELIKACEGYKAIAEAILR